MREIGQNLAQSLLAIDMGCGDEMSRVRPDGPVITVCDGDVGAHRTVEEAAMSMEGYDVVSGLCEAWDSRGFRLTLLGEKSPTPPEIWFDPETSGAPEPETPTAHLRRWLGAITAVPLQIEDVEAASLDELIAEEIRLDELPGPFVRWWRRVFGRGREPEE